MSDALKLPAIGKRKFLAPLDQRPTFIYALLDPNTDEIRYIGQTVRKLGHRLQGHVCASRTPSSYVNSWVKSVGYPKITPLMIVDGHFANETERAVIKRFRERGYRLVNIEEGGRSGLQRQFTLEQRRKFSASRMGHSVSAETRRKLSEAHKGKVVKPETREKLRLANLGKKHSEETKAKMGRAAKGRTATPETREKLRIWNTGRKMGPPSEEWKAKVRAKLSGPNCWMYGRKLSPEEIARIVKMNTGRRATEEQREHMREAQRLRRERERLERANV